MSSLSQKAEDNGRFADWGREHGQAVRGYLVAMLGKADLAEDLTQEVFCRAWRGRERYCEQGNARAYLLRIADRLACDWLRKPRREITLKQEDWKRIEPVSHAADPYRALARAEAAEQLAKALDDLTPAQRRVLLLRYYGQLSFAQIADIVDCPLGTALSHCHRGLKTLRKLLVESVT